MDKKPWTAKFWSHGSGLHNRSKGMTIITMAELSLSGDNSFYPVCKISKMSGVKSHTLFTSMKRWVSWHYFISKKEYLLCRSNRNGIHLKGRYTYRISKKGLEYFFKIPVDVKVTLKKRIARLKSV